MKNFLQCNVRNLQCNVAIWCNAMLIFDIISKYINIVERNIIDKRAVKGVVNIET
jgi:hypothetical protein